MRFGSGEIANRSALALAMHLGADLPAGQKAAVSGITLRAASRHCGKAPSRCLKFFTTLHKVEVGPRHATLKDPSVCVNTNSTG
jgi:hypothetical protein